VSISVHFNDEGCSLIFSEFTSNNNGWRFNGCRLVLFGNQSAKLCL